VPRILEDSRSFRADRAWGALDLAEVEGATVRLHWTDSPYQWHVNDGIEVFAVLDGVVNMHYRADGEEKAVRLEAGAIFVAEAGDEHVARPEGEARILVVERKGSI
jgi:mannose-6-phosphate isomerase-like protein (cupin superfamily)